MNIKRLTESASLAITFMSIITLIGIGVGLVGWMLYAWIAVSPISFVLIFGSFSFITHVLHVEPKWADDLLNKISKI